MSRLHLSLIVLLGLLLLTPVVFADNEETAPTSTRGQAVSFYQDTPTDETPSPVFDGISAIFATLGIYVVTMFTMAIGTEIVVDILKGVVGKPFGLKSKPNTRKTIADYKAFLPGNLEDLGISAEAKRRLEKQVHNLEKLLEPLFTVEAVNYHLREKEFSAALTAVHADHIGPDLIDKAKEAVKEQIQTLIDNIDTTSTLGKTIQVTCKKGDLLNKVERKIDRLGRKAAQVTPEQIYAATAELISGEFADGVTAWTRAYFNSLQEESYETAKSIYENKLQPQIRAFGLGDNLQQQIEGQFDRFLDTLQTYRGTDIYIDSLNQLLTDLENQRNQVQSGIAALVERFINWIKELLRRTRLQHPMLSPTEISIRINDSGEAASKLLTLEHLEKQQEKQRIQRLRFLSVILGTGIAYFLRVDSVDLLKDLFPADASFLYITIISQDSAFLNWLQNTLRIPAFDLTAGIILTGLAVSAGSTFWHDQLGRLQSIKKRVDGAEEVLRPIIIQTQQGIGN